MENKELVEAAEVGLCHRAAVLGRISPTPAAFIERVQLVFAIADALISPKTPTIWLRGMGDESSE